MDSLKPVKQEMVLTKQIDLKIEDHAIEAKPWQYPQNINPVKQEIVSTEQMDIKLNHYLFEAEPWQYLQRINPVKQDCFIRTIRHKNR